MSSLRDALQKELGPILDEFSRRINSQTSGVTTRTGSSFNDSFLLRSYVCYGRRDGSEVAITIDVKIDDGVLNVESEMCRDDGYVYKEGPSLRKRVVDEQQAAALFQRWLVELQDYLIANEQYFVSLALVS